MVPTFWKLSHGQEYFTYRQLLDAMNARLVYVHRGTGGIGGSSVSQATSFVEVPIGDYFYLTHGNQGVYLLGQFVGPANLFSERKGGWLDRPYRFIRSSITPESYDGLQKGWSANYNSTFARVPESELPEFEELILEPFFGISLADYGLELEA
jgi:hypothetical protein